jgi:hypothetical protein
MLTILKNFQSMTILDQSMAAKDVETGQVGQVGSQFYTYILTLD